MYQEFFEHDVLHFLAELCPCDCDDLQILNKVRVSSDVRFDALVKRFAELKQIIGTLDTMMGFRGNSAWVVVTVDDDSYRVLRVCDLSGIDVLEPLAEGYEMSPRHFAQRLRNLLR